jgi:RNA polymerase sigma-70 factor (ECF subfamily)
MDLKSASDEELIEASQRKDLLALEEFFDRHHRIAMAVAYRILEDREAAEDVLQEAFLAVWRQANTYNSGRGSARTWFLSIVRHRAIDVTRGKSFGRQRTSLDELNFELSYPDVWHQVDARLDNQRVRDAVASLPPEQRDAVMMAYFGGLTHPEIAERTGVPLGTVKGRLRLALQKLRSLLIDLEAGAAH